MHAHLIMRYYLQQIEWYTDEANDTQFMSVADTHRTIEIQQ